MTQRVDGSRLGFLAMSFLLVCLAGVFATYAAPIPYARGMLREEALDAALATRQAADPQAALTALRDRLGDQAAIVIDGKGSLADRVAAGRVALRQLVTAEGAESQSNLRLLIIVTAVICGLLGGALSGAGMRRG